MTEKELKKLGRVDLLEILIEQGKEIERLKTDLEKAEAKLKERSLKIEKAGSIAEASLLINGVYEAAQESAKQYLENIENLSQKQEEICARMEAESIARCKQMEKESMTRCEKREKECEERCMQNEAACEAAMKKVLAETGKYWKEVRSIIKGE